MLEIKNLTKSYGDVLALDRFSLDLKKGEVLGLLGPNGAGKTTLISILSGTVGGFTGTVNFRGRNLFADREIKNRLGIVPQDMAFYDELSAMDNLLFWGGLYDVPRADLKKRAVELLELVELAARAKEPVKNFSGGMKRRLNTAIGLLHKPDLLLLDEPTVGIDVQAKVSILDIIRDVGAAGTAATPSSQHVYDPTDYGAKPDGKTLCTAAIQKALGDLQFHKDFCVLYFPAGTYRITDTVKTVRKAHHDGMGMALVGEGVPAATVAVAVAPLKVQLVPEPEMNW